MSYEKIEEKDEASYIYRDKSEKNVAKFRRCLSCINWDNIEGSDDPTKAYSGFLNGFTNVYNDCFPLKNPRKRRSGIGKPWLSTDLLKSIKKKTRLYKQYLNSPSIDKNIKYKRYKNKLNHSLRIAKRFYYEQLLERNKLNCKKTWNI